MREVIRQKIVDSLAAPVPDFTRRDVRLPGVKGKAVAVIGMRRTGKTTFLWQVLADRLAKGTAREGLLYFSFEDERLAGMAAGDLQLLVEEYYRLHPEWRGERKRAVLLLDEIQVVPGWETFARRLLDAERVELLLSGSSARLLSREVATSMRGRAMEALVHPFSFRECLRKTCFTNDHRDFEGGIIGFSAILRPGRVCVPASLDPPDLSFAGEFPHQLRENSVLTASDTQIVTDIPRPQRSPRLFQMSYELLFQHSQIVYGLGRLHPIHPAPKNQ